jgi:hypothetical protein
VSAFLENAVQIFETAEVSSEGGASADIGLLIDLSGALRIVDATGWRPDALRQHYGAGTVYRVTRRAGKVEVHGHSQGCSCVIQSHRPAARHLFDPPYYQVEPARLLR